MKSKLRFILIVLFILNSCNANVQNLTEQLRQEQWLNKSFSHDFNLNETNTSIDNNKMHYCSSLPCNLKYCFYYKVKIDGVECLECGCE
jgi:hypothetical protein